MSCSDINFIPNSKNELVGNNKLIKNGSPIINSLPLDVIRLIAFFFIEKPEDLVRLGLVNRRFSFLTLDVHLCSFVLAKFFPLANPIFCKDSPLLYKQIMTKNFNIKKGHFRLQTLPFQTQETSCMTIHNGKLISTAHITADIKIWDLHSGQELQTLSAHQLDVTCLATYNDMLISGSWDGDIKIWDLHSGQELQTLSAHQHGVFCLAIYNDMLISGGHDHDIKIWDLDCGQELQTLSGHQDRILCLTIYNHMLISGSSDSNIKIWDLRSGQELQTLSGHRLGVSCLAIYNDMLISGSYDHDIKIWDLLSGQELKTLSGHRFGVSCLTICNDMLISGGYDHDIKIWDLLSGQELKTLRQPFEVSCLSVCGSKLFYGLSYSPKGSLGILDFGFPSLSPYSKQVLQNNLFILEKMLWAPYHGQPIEELAKMLHPDFQERLRQHCYKLGVPFPHCSISAIFRVKTDVCVWALLDAIHDKDQKRMSGLLNQLIHINPQNAQIYELLWEICKGPEMWRWGEFAFHNQRGCSASLLQKEQAVIQFIDILKKRWGEDLPLLLVDLGIFNEKAYSEKLGCPSHHLSKIGICSVDDLKALGLFKHSFHFDALKVVHEEEIKGNDMAAIKAEQDRAVDKKENVFSLLGNLYEAVKKMASEAEDGAIFFETGSNIWIAFQSELEHYAKDLSSRSDKHQNILKTFSPESYAKIVDKMNAFIKQFHECEREHQIAILSNYVNQYGILLAWNTLYTPRGIKSLATLLNQADAPKDPFRMGV